MEDALKWLKGEASVYGYNDITFNPKQVEYFNAKERHNMIAGALSSGKTLAFVVKFILFSHWFPGSRSIIGRKSKENAANTFMKDFQEIVPEGMYEYKVGEGKIVWPNGSVGEFWGLDSLVSGDDTGKSPQKLKSHNFHFGFLDQLEEIDKELYDSVASRIRAKMCKHADQFFTKYKKNGQIIFEVCGVCQKVSFNQINSTTNPANYWGYDFFKIHPHPNSHLVETSMLDNKALSQAYVQDMLTRPKKWVDRFVHGRWENWGDSEKLVFLEDYIRGQQIMKPVRDMNGMCIFAEPTEHEYQIGHDPSEGATDPCATVVFDKTIGEVAAVFTGFIPAKAQAEKVVQFALMYSRLDRPLIVPETNGVGAAFLEQLKPLYDKIYVRETYNQRESKRTNKLGWNTNLSSKSLLIEHAKTLFEKGFIKIHDKRIIDEFLQFEYSDEVGRQGASAKKGAHDDLVMATLLAVWNCQPTTPLENKLFKRIKNSQNKPIKYTYV